MSAPKLELCVGILQVLREKGQLSASRIATKVKISSILLNQVIRLLAEQGMVSETENNNLVVYDITNSGKKVLKFFGLDNSSKNDKTLSSVRLISRSDAFNPLKP
jgi:predicted transcriptional regulator